MKKKFITRATLIITELEQLTSDPKNVTNALAFEEYEKPT